MPIYEYVCDECGEKEEIFFQTPIKDHVPPGACSKCGSNKMRRNFTPILFDVVGGTMHEVGKRNWKQNMSLEKQSDVLLGEANPY